jgi:hypothetical protein
MEKDEAYGENPGVHGVPDFYGRPPPSGPRSWGETHCTKLEPPAPSSFQRLIRYEERIGSNGIVLEDNFERYRIGGGFVLLLSPGAEERNAQACC